MSNYNKKLSEAASIGRCIEFWKWIIKRSNKIAAIATRKMEKCIAKQNILMVDIYNDTAGPTGV